MEEWICRGMSWIRRRGPPGGRVDRVGGRGLGLEGVRGEARQGERSVPREAGLFCDDLTGFPARRGRCPAGEGWGGSAQATP